MASEVFVAIKNGDSVVYGHFPNLFTGEIGFDQDLIKTFQWLSSLVKI